MSAPSVAAVDAITKVADPVVRNLQITQCYHELSQAFTELTGREANWCSFATWASRQAGQSIRGEDPLRAFEALFRESAGVAAAIEPVIAELGRLGVAQSAPSVLDAVLGALDARGALERSGAAVAEGNLKVFDEIAREFARFLAEFGEDTAWDEAKTARFCAVLRDGEAPDGQRRLRHAFATYARARFETDAKKRAELLLLANLLVGYHEQIRLQPDITAAMNAGFGDEAALKQRMLAALVPKFWLRVRVRVARVLGRPLPLDRLFESVSAAAQQQLRQAITATLMRLQIAEAEPILLAGSPGKAYPGELQRLTNAELKALLDEVDPTGTPGEAKVADWANFDQRIRFIARLFRAWHRTPELFEPPFSYDQEVALKAGLRPAGRI